MKDHDSDKNDILLQKIPGETEAELKIEKLTEEWRKEYHNEHGRWPEQDGLLIHINL